MSDTTQYHTCRRKQRRSCEQSCFFPTSFRRSTVAVTSPSFSLWQEYHKNITSKRASRSLLLLLLYVQILLVFRTSHVAFGFASAYSFSSRRHRPLATRLYLDTASSASKQHKGKRIHETKKSQQPNENAMNIIKTDNVIPWNDVLVSLQPISCDPGDEECFQRQRMAVSAHGDAVSSIDNSDVALTRKEQRNLGLAIFFTLLAVVGLIKQSGPGSWRYYLAGAICATSSHVIPVPIDTVKTRKQVDPEFSKLHFIPAFVRIWQQEGSKGLLAGLGPTAIGYALEGGIKFGVYEALKPIVATGLPRLATLTPWLYFLKTKVMAFAVCAAFSGVAASVVLCPMESLRIRMVANPNSQLGWFRTALMMIKTEGMMSLVKGMEPMIYKQVPYTITKNVSFDFITRYFYATIQNTWQPRTIGPIIKFVVPFTAAAAASILSCISSQPGDVLLSLVNAQQNDVRRTRDVVRDVLRSERGWKGFYVGTKARFLHVGIVVTLQLLIYDIVKRICGIAATGIAK